MSLPYGSLKRWFHSGGCGRTRGINSTSTARRTRSHLIGDYRRAFSHLSLFVSEPGRLRANQPMALSERCIEDYTERRDKRLAREDK